MYTILKDHIPTRKINRMNENRSWKYGYNEDYDVIIISKDGTLGEIYRINSINIGLPAVPPNLKKGHNKWVVEEYPKDLKSIQKMAEWNRRDNKFKNKWIDYIETEFNRRDEGYWFINNSLPTYISGSHYMYLKWSKIDVGLPDFREANRLFFLFWEACKADDRCFGICYLKIRRSGFSFMASSECNNIGTSITKSHVGIMSKTGTDAKSLFTEKVVNIFWNYPFFFKPMQSGMDRPKNELMFSLPATKITRKNMNESSEEQSEGLDTTIDWRNTADNAYDSQKLQLLIEDEAGKITKPESVLAGWRVRKTCLRLGSKIIGKCMMGSTSNKLSEGGENYKKMYENSNPAERNKNGQTKSGLYALYIPTEWNLEGYIDEYGFPIFNATKEKPVKEMNGDLVTMGVIEYWNNEVEGKKSDPDELNEFYRQYSRTTAHAFRDESKQSLFNLEKIYTQIDYNDGLLQGRYLTKGYFSWYNGIRFGKVVWTPSAKGRFLVSWIPPLNMQNAVYEKNGLRYPLNDQLGAFGCDPYDISGVVGGGGSKGSLHGKTQFHMMPDIPSTEFFLEYIARTDTAEIFFEDVLMAIHFYGMPILVENNKPRLLYHIKHAGYRAFSMNRPDKHKNQLSQTELELGGIPNSSEDIKQAHASAIQTYIEKNVGYDTEGTYRPTDICGQMPFTKTLEDWALFDIANRTKHDASISSGLAIMATQKNLYLPEVKKQKISIRFAKYDNSGSISKVIQ